MYEASFGDFLQVILVILLIYFALKFIFRLYGAAILRFIFRKIGQKFEKKFREQQGFPPPQRERKTTIDKNKPKSRKAKKEVGEYIDYEEID
ncbi:MAG TPA: DUF4834 domain-containing protein [Flavobacteriaceae bacterium]|nr:DUF4834 domain-containing protein [Flavobacteriaceae bacterium]